MPSTEKYDAFISYSHAADRPLATGLQTALGKFAKPWYRLRALRTFRDDASLSANPALWQSIQQALGNTHYFLLLASPESADSEWVQREIAYWFENNSPATFLIVQTAGTLEWSAEAGDFDWRKTDCLPPTMEGVFQQEPRHVDMRWARGSSSLSLRDSKFRDVIADLAAPLHGRSKDDMIGEDVFHA